MKAECFQWVRADPAVDEFSRPDPKRRAAEEISDVLVYLLRLADVLEIDIAKAVTEKMEDSRRRFATDEFQGVAPFKL
ncbi:nucleotide pyrophosphohydrolase [Tessaracoccus rhinocerotis]|uniref:Nucleotide pyrophosphohydrolase n=1 Tax=Tessaracoccus rhinocerotis TaxID=1689449 RepID=A0A553JZM2_9ACTN|nr:MazG-like family protein [Tessaracoccus rhinocerotis]TRY17899.1 nucleotide pyrophosphohydrolase [Tessaracoccus rhinocerotis]